MIKKKRIKFFHIKILILVFTMIIVGVGGYVYTARQFNVIATFNPVARSVGSRMVDYRTRNYSFVETDHFIIKYDEGISKEILDLAKTTAEDKYKEVVQVFQYAPKNKVMMILYNDAEKLKRNTMLSGSDKPPMGVYYGDTIHILDPTLWIKDEENIENIFYSEGPILHELVHLLTDHVARGNFPLWFTEGVSLYFEYKIDGYEWGRGMDVDTDQYNLGNLTNNFHELDQYFAYTQSFRIIKDFVDQHGIEALMDLLRDLGKGQDFKTYNDLFKGEG
ncbi:MAG: hypothetical protein JJT76_03180 [Clostridiaceae bacterium]|nr:hypothetical protein [Clostridiaceae bacterium]